MPTILTVVDNFFSREKVTDFTKVSEQTLVEFGDEVRRFASTYELPEIDQSDHPSYLGGWASANFWEATSGQLVMSSLLYSGKVLVKDPISDWFSLEQYQVPRGMSARPGFLDRAGNFQLTETQNFLNNVVPALIQLRPLIEQEIIVLAPARKNELLQQDLIRDLQQRMQPLVVSNPREFAKRFSPREIPTDDTRRGIFMFAGGDRETQIIREVSTSLYYFASEYALANDHGFQYTAPFKYEQYLCETGLTNAIQNLPGTKVMRAIFSSSLPLYSGLSPEIVAEIRNDDNYLEFRKALFDIYRDVPINSDRKELKRYLDELENLSVKPVLERVKKEVEDGRISKKGVRLTGKFAKMGAGLLVGGMTNPASIPAMLLNTGVTKSLQGLIDKMIDSKKQPDPHIIWKKLYLHNKSHETEIDQVQDVNAMNINQSRNKDYWGIPSKPSMNVYITEGSMIADWTPPLNKK